MQRLWSLSLLLLLCCCFFGSQANRVYVHPFYLFAAENVSCVPIKAQPDRPLDTLPVAALDINVLAPDNRDPSDQDGLRQNVTQRTAVLAELMNALGLRIYQNLNKKHGANTLFSPVNAFGSLVTFYLGASVKTASSYQEFLGFALDTDRADCVRLVNGHTVLKTLQSINSRVDDGPKDEIITRVWAFTRRDCRLSEDFIQGTQDFSDASFIRGVDFSGPQEAEEQVNNFVEKTSDGTVKGLFKDLSSDAKLLFFSSFSFKGNWRTAFQPEKTSMQEFHVDDTTTVLVPLMTRTGRYSYFNDKGRRCTVVKLPLSAQSYMLLVMPHEGVSVHDIDPFGLRTDIIFGWSQNFKEGLLELSLPKFSMSTVTDLRGMLNNTSAEVETLLLGSKAEFDRLSTTKPFTIDKALYRVSVEMSEGGAEQQDNNQEAGIPLKLSINRPFFFTVIEGDSNAILLLGKITKPTL